MGAALKKDQDYASLTRLRWAAWGVVNIETLERTQRRNYINHTREELKLHGLTLECGGTTSQPYYRIFEAGGVTVPGSGAKPKWSTTCGSSTGDKSAFTKVCLEALKRIDPEAFQELKHV